MSDNLTWNRIGHNPTTWGLGKRDGPVLINIVAQTSRKPDGSWQWESFNKKTSLTGNEPSRLEALEAATKSMRNFEQLTPYP